MYQTIMYLFFDLFTIFHYLHGFQGWGYICDYNMKIIVVLIVLGFVKAVEEGIKEIPLVSYEIFVPEIQVYDAVSTIFQV